ncbi:MAG: hypothetical protein ABSD02_07975 [Steroidobacteraceae bacterium]|jgi:hypothetical protein
MNTFKRMSMVIAIVAILGSSGCFWGRGGWGGNHGHDHDHEGDRGSAHYAH